MVQKKQRQRESIAAFMGMGDNRREYQAYLHVMRRLMGDILTKRQRECMVAYYFEGRLQEDISREYSISVSCVSRHLKAGRLRLAKEAGYLMELMRLLPVPEE